MENKNRQLSQEKRDFLLEIAYVTEQIAYAHIIFKEGMKNSPVLSGKTITD